VGLKPLLAQRDDLITLLAHGDPRLPMDAQIGLCRIFEILSKREKGVLQFPER
jgi:hypothetical protein